MIVIKKNNDVKITINYKFVYGRVETYMYINGYNKKCKTFSQ